MRVSALFEAEVSESSMGGNPCGRAPVETCRRGQIAPTVGAAGEFGNVWANFTRASARTSATDALSAFMAAIRALPNGPNCRGAGRGSLPRIEFLRMRSQRVTPDEVFEKHSCS